MWCVLASAISFKRHTAPTTRITTVQYDFLYGKYIHQKNPFALPQFAGFPPTERWGTFPDDADTACYYTKTRPTLDAEREKLRRLFVPYHVALATCGEQGWIEDVNESSTKLIWAYALYVNASELSPDELIKFNQFLK